MIETQSNFETSSVLKLYNMKKLFRKTFLLENEKTGLLKGLSLAKDKLAQLPERLSQQVSPFSLNSNNSG